jgi:hypothetical protein
MAPIAIGNSVCPNQSKSYLLVHASGVRNEPRIGTVAAFTIKTYCGLMHIFMTCIAVFFYFVLGKYECWVTLFALDYAVLTF